MTQLQGAEDNYYHTVKYILEITSKAREIFESSEVDEKRQLIKLLLQNLRLSGKNIVYDVQKPFDMILKAGDGLLWCPLANAFRTGNIDFTVSLQQMQTAFSLLGIAIPV